MGSLPILGTDFEYDSRPECCDSSLDLQFHKKECLNFYGAKRLIKNQKCIVCNHKRKETYYVPYPYILGNKLPKEDPIWRVMCYFCGMLEVTDGRESVLGWTEEKILSRVVKVYCDGGLIGMNKYGGTWGWCGVSAGGERIITEGGFVVGPPTRPAVGLAPTRPVTNNHTEQIAIVKALEKMPEGWKGIVISDSKIALGRVFNPSWAKENLPSNIIDRTTKAFGRVHPDCVAMNIQGHPTEKDLREGIGEKRNKPVSIHNVWCDWEAERQREEYFRVYDIEGSPLIVPRKEIGQ